MKLADKICEPNFSTQLLAFLQ